MTSPRPALRTWLVRFGVFFALNMAACAGLYRWAFVDRTLPPSGPSGVGTRTFVIEAPSTDDALSDEPGPTRRLPVQAWYPAAGAAGTVTDGAEPAVQSAPVVLFVHGALGRRETNVSLYRVLASHGYVVLAADHPGAAMPASYPDGTQVWPSGRFRDALKAGSPDEAAATTAFPRFVDTMVADGRAVLDGVGSLGIEPTARVWAGHSLGSATALDGCREDTDCAAAVALDGPPYGRIAGPPGSLALADAGQRAPLLAVTSANLQAYPEARQVYAALGDEVRRSTGGAWWLTMEGGHLDLTDVPLLVRADLARPMLGGEIQLGPGDPEPRMRALCGAVLTFLDSAVRGEGVFDAEAGSAGTPLSVRLVVPGNTARPDP